MATVSVVGIGKLGLCMAACIADAGFDVIGVDIDPAIVRTVNDGGVPYVEPGLAERLRRAHARGNLRATTSIAEAVAASDTTFVVVATPTLPDGTYSNAQLEASLDAIGAALGAKSAFHVVAVSCTVMPGTMQALAIPLLERASGKRLGDGWGLAYNPEFIAMGDVIRIFSEPDFVLVGESDRRVGDRLATIYRCVCPNDPVLARMNLVSAELTKIALNCYVTTKIVFSNMLAEICEHVPGADVDAITTAMGRDARIGPKALKGGLSFGGPCFPRDNRAFATFAEGRGLAAPLARLVQRMNERADERLAARIAGLIEPGATIAVLGLAYKANTPLVDESPSLKIIRHLLDRGYCVCAYDPFAIETTRRALGDAVLYAESPEACLRDCAAVIVAVDCPQTRALGAAVFRRSLAPNGLVVDCWRLYRNEDFTGLRYEAIGLPPACNTPARAESRPRVPIYAAPMSLGALP